MTYNYNSSTIAMNGQTFSIGTVDGGERPSGPPKGLIATQAVQTSNGYLGQIFVDKEIVWEEGPFENGRSAIDAANAQVVDKIKKLFIG